jgi:hypothetical protein
LPGSLDQTSPLLNLLLLLDGLFLHAGEQLLLLGYLLSQH